MAPSLNGENGVPDSIPPVPNPDERGPPPSMPLEGEKGQQSSSHVDETGTHLETPQDQSRTTSPIRTLHDKGSSGEGQGVVIGHRQTQCRRGEARDKAGGDEEGQETRGNEGERSRMRECERAASTVEERCQHTTKDNDNDSLSPPPLPKHPTPPPPPSPNYPERLRRDDDVDTTKSNKTAARQRADAVHDPGGEMDAPDSVPPSVWLEGEKGKATSLNIETDNNEVDETKPSRNPVGMTDSDKRRPSEPTEPPDEKEGERGVDAESRDKTTVKNVESKTSS
ncbi:hypothetical protein PAXINDRAFT_11186 [Paxillus involutus ATCC 200175]|nr:hypothetical protein PAXINDRAFT_11186 [Paxillus involutus ATCC 200175]